MNLIDLYASEVGRRLPQKMRPDIEAEIRSTLQDLLDEHSRRVGKPADDGMVLAVLKEYGDPEKVAASYVGDRFLIGPQLYPNFVKVVFPVVLFTVILVLTGLGSWLFLTHSTTGDWIQLVTQTIGNLVGSVLLTSGIIAFIFAILERAVPEFRLKKAEWDPHSLLNLKPTDRIRAGIPIISIVLTCLAIRVFNFSPAIMMIGGTGTSVTEAWQCNPNCYTFHLLYSLSFLSATFYRYLYALDVLWGLSIVLFVLLVSQGYWRTWTRWADVGLKALAIGLAAWMLAGPTLIGITAADLKAAGFSTVAAQANLSIDLLNQLVRVVLGLMIVLSGEGLVRQLIRLLRRPKPMRSNPGFLLDQQC